MYNNISYNKDYYTIEKLMNSRKQNSVVYENDNCMWLDIKIISQVCCFKSAYSYFPIMTCPLTRTQMENNMRY